MRILLSGSNGLVGSALSLCLKAGGHAVVPLARSKSDPKAVFWDPNAGALDPAGLEDFESVIHLAGEPIASGRWTPAKKQRIRDSRTLGTRLLAEALARVKRPPSTFVCASAIGYYGDRGQEILREESAPGPGFLAEVCRQWESAAIPAAQKGIRLVNLRFGIILSKHGGALARMLLPFKLGLGGKIGSGRQYMSWIALEDALGAIEHILRTMSLQGPVNVAAPRPVTNFEFTNTLGRVLRRPTLLPIPAFAARLIFGEMADELLLASQRVEPARLIRSGYPFRYPDLEGALKHLLRPAENPAFVAPA